MKNTLENKAGLFSKYWGQFLLRRQTSNDLYKNELVVLAYLDEEYLELTPLSMITDEDAIEVAIIIKYTIGKDMEAFSMVGKHIVFNMFKTRRFMDPEMALLLFDFLRSKGYALPYMGISVEKQIEYGWIKLCKATK